MHLIFNSFNPFLLLISLVIYSTLSLCPITRKICNTILVSYLLSLIIPTYIPQTQCSIVAGATILISGFLFCMLYSETVIGLSMFVWMMVLSAYIYACVYFNIFTMDIKIFGWSLLQHSNYVFRESLLATVISCSTLVNKDHRVKQRDLELGILIAVLYIL